MTGSAASASTAVGSTSADGATEVTFPTPTPTPAPAATTAAPTAARESGSSASTYLRSPSGAGPSPWHPPPAGSDCKSGSKGERKGDDDSAQETPEQLQQRRRTTGSCSFYPSKVKECAEPRNCFDCLNFVVEGEDGGCMLNDFGRCVPVRMFYNASMDFSLYKAANANVSSSSTGSSTGSSASSATAVQLPSSATDLYHFRADKAEYCAKNDALCTSCRRSVFADFIEGQTDRGRSAYCLGDNGCVCIATCEARRDRPPALPKDCFAKTFAANKKDNKSVAGGGQWASVSAILGAMLFVVVTVFAIYRIRSRGERRTRMDSIGDGSSDNSSSSNGTAAGGSQANAVATPEAGSSPSNTPMVTVVSTTAAAGSRLLNLFGWQAMRDDLINKEHMRFAGVEEPVSPVKHSNVQFLGVEPSAPEIDSAMPTAPMAAMAIPVPMAVLASAPMVFSVRAMASAPDFEDMDDDVEVL